MREFPDLASSRRHHAEFHTGLLSIHLSRISKKNLPKRGCGVEQDQGLLFSATRHKAHQASASEKRRVCLGFGYGRCRAQ